MTSSSGRVAATASLTTRPAPLRAVAAGTSRRRGRRPGPGRRAGPARRCGPRRARRCDRRGEWSRRGARSRIAVRVRTTPSRPRRIAASVSVSTAESASSRIRIGGSIISARAIAVRCFWPPESVSPRSPTVVVQRSGKVSTSTSRRATATACFEILDGVPLRGAEGDVAGDGVAEEERLLRHHADAPAQDAEREIAHVDAVDEDRARRRIVEPRQQAHERRLAAAGRADDGERRARRHAQRDVVQDGAPARLRLWLRRAIDRGTCAGLGVGKRQVPPLDGAGEARRRVGARPVDDRGRDIEHLEHPAPGGRAALEQVGDPPEGDHRPTEHRQVGVERHELADGEPALDHRTAAEPQHHERAQAEQERQARVEHPLQPDQARVAAQEFLVGDRGSAPARSPPAGRRAPPARPTAPPGSPR